MSRTFFIASLTAAALAGSALAGESNLFSNSGLDANKLFTNNSSAALLSSGGASTLSVQTSNAGSLFSTSTTSSAGASEIGKAAMGGFTAENNAKAAFGAAAANSTLLSK